MASGFEEVVVKVKNRYYDMRAVLASTAVQRRQARAARHREQRVEGVPE